MAERRMFAKTIVLSDAFLDMPLSARCLYFTLGMLADDDGFINSPKSVMRQCGSSIDDLNILIAKKFLIPFDSGVVVIKHWRINNYLRNDRYQETKYIDEKNRLLIDENGSYKSGIPGIPPGIPNSGIPSIGQDRLDKDSIGKDRLGKDITPPIIPPKGDIVVANPRKKFDEERFAKFYAAYPKKQAKQNAIQSWAKIEMTDELFAQIMRAVEQQKQSDQWLRDNGKYIPMPSTWLNQKRWEDELTRVRDERKFMWGDPSETDTLPF